MYDDLIISLLEELIRICQKNSTQQDYILKPIKLALQGIIIILIKFLKIFGSHKKEDNIQMVEFKQVNDETNESRQNFYQKRKHSDQKQQNYKYKDNQSEQAENQSENGKKQDFFNESSTQEKQVQDNENQLKYFGLNDFQENCFGDQKYQQQQAYDDSYIEQNNKEIEEIDQSTNNQTNINSGLQEQAGQQKVYQNQQISQSELDLKLENQNKIIGNKINQNFQDNDIQQNQFRKESEDKQIQDESIEKKENNNDNEVSINADKHNILQEKVQLNVQATDEKQSIVNNSMLNSQQSQEQSERQDKNQIQAISNTSQISYQSGNKEDSKEPKINQAGNNPDKVNNNKMDDPESNPNLNSDPKTDPNPNSDPNSDPKPKPDPTPTTIEPILMESKQEVQKNETLLDALAITEEIYSKSYKNRAVPPELKNFIGEPQDFNELVKYYFGGQKSNYKQAIEQMKQELTGYRRIRGDGNCFYTAFTYQYFTLLLKDAQRREEFLQQINNLLVSITYQDIKIENNTELVKEFIRQFSQLQNEEQLFELMRDYDLNFYGLSIMVMRNYIVQIYRNSEYLYKMGGKEYLVQNQLTLTWEEECNNNEIIIKALTSHLKLNVTVYFIDKKNYSYDRKQYGEEGQPKLGLLLSPGHYQIGLLR